jgi:hypothetical protein
MAGLLSGDECADLMARSRAVIVPSTWEEPFGLVVVEAMAAGTPVIASGHGSFTELVTPGVDGDLFPPSDAAALATAIALVAAEPEKYEVYGKQARETYEQKFNPEASLRNLLEIYNFAIANPASARDSRSALLEDHMRGSTNDAIETTPHACHLTAGAGSGTAASHRRGAQV